METEIKLRFKSRRAYQAFLQDPWFSRLLPPASRQRIRMISWYYDTESRALSRKQVSLRIRQENRQACLTVKQGGKVTAGLHQRAEWNAAWHQPIPAVLGLGEVYQAFDQAVISEPAAENPESLLRQITKDSLFPVCRVQFSRLAALYPAGASLAEIACDAGFFRADGCSEPFMELEIELIKGSLEPILALADQLCARFDLARESRSKLARCLALRKENEDYHA